MLFMDENFQSETNFQLQTFGIEMILNENQLENFTSFLKTQSSTLETLKIRGRSLTFSGLEIILTMPRLKKLVLHLSDVSTAPLLAARFETKLSVTSLHLCDISENKVFLSIVLKTFPRLEYLAIYHLDTEAAALISQKCHSLKQLSAGRFTASSIFNENFYLNLRKFNCNVVVAASKKLFQRLNGELISSANYESQMWPC